MKQIIYLSLAILLFAVSSCSDDDRANGTGNEGQIVIQVEMADTEPLTRADLPGLTEWKPEEVCKIEILKGEEIIDSFTGLSNIPSSLKLTAGEYTLKVTAGEEKRASFTDCFYAGETTFQVTAGETTPVQLACKLKNTLATIRFTNELLNLIETDFQVYIVGEETNDRLFWTRENQGSTGYFTLTDTKDLTWAVEGNLNGKTISVSKRAGVIESVKPNTNYILTFNFDDGLETPDLSFELEIKESDPQDDTVDYIPDTEIEGGDFDLENPLPIEKGTEQDVAVNINSPYTVTSILVSVNEATKAAFELDVNSFDFMAMESAEIAQYATKGIIFQSTPIVKSDSEIAYSITIAASKVSELEAGEYAFDIEVTNEKSKTSQATLKLEITEEAGSGEIPVETDDLIISEVWAKRATLKATLLNETDLELSFDYRVSGTSEWNLTPATLSGTKVTANITGLQPSTTYEYRVKAGDREGEIKTFTTEAAAQLPNSSFEHWTTQTEKLPPFNTAATWAVPNAPDVEKFWDSGNMGSAAGGKTLTSENKITDYVTHGESSIKLESMTVGIGPLTRFAAGNLFVGEFQEILIKSALSASTAGGKLTFGREFTTRPVALKGKFRYTCGGKIQVDKNVKLPTDLVEDGANKESNDKAAIYVALSDKGSPYTIINTNATGLTTQYFDKNDENIIAIGEWEQQDSTNEMAEFVINLDYRSLDRIPTHIVVVCSSSKYGDYFTGAPGSILWLDDFELIYE